jgi:hypothetical protein
LSGHDTEDERGGKREGGERKVWKGSGKTTKVGRISTRRENKRVEAEKKGEKGRRRGKRGKRLRNRRT